MHPAEIKDWIFLRGLGREALHWRGFLVEFAKHFPHVRAHTLDLPGTGVHHHERSPSRLEEITNTLHDVWERSFPAPPPVILVGLSLGGMVAMDWALRFHRQTAGVVLINSSLGSLSPVYRRLRPRLLSGPLEFLRGPRVEQQEKLALALVSNKPAPQEETLQEWIEIQKKHPVSPGTLWRQLIAAATFRPQWESLHVPGIILVSEKDRMVDPRCSEDIAAKTQWPILRHPWGGHDLVHDDAEWICHALQDWCRKQ